MAHETLSLLVRWLHVAAMALTLGGALLVWVVALRPGEHAPASQGRLLLGLAEHYERLFWLGIGLLVMTGVGNLGAFGLGLPEPASPWGQRLGLKLAAVLLLLAFSVLRTVVVIRLSAAGEAGLAPTARRLPAFYAGTALALGAIVLLAVVLAHG
jgi:uncharacterized membrane protein